MAVAKEEKNENESCQQRRQKRTVTQPRSKQNHSHFRREITELGDNLFKEHAAKNMDDPRSPGTIRVSFPEAPLLVAAREPESRTQNPNLPRV